MNLQDILEMHMKVAGPYLPGEASKLIKTDLGKLIKSGGKILKSTASKQPSLAEKAVKMTRKLPGSMLYNIR